MSNGEGKPTSVLSRVHTTHSTIHECYQRSRKCAAVTPECSWTQQWFISASYYPNDRIQMYNSHVQADSRVGFRL